MCDLKPRPRHSARRRTSSKAAETSSVPSPWLNSLAEQNVAPWRAVQTNSIWTSQPTWISRFLKYLIEKMSGSQSSSKLSTCHQHHNRTLLRTFSCEAASVMASASCPMWMAFEEMQWLCRILVDHQFHYYCVWVARLCTGRLEILGAKGREEQSYEPAKLRTLGHPEKILTHIWKV